MSKTHLRSAGDVPHCHNVGAVAMKAPITHDWRKVTCNKCKETKKYKNMLPAPPRKANPLTVKEPYSLAGIDMTKINKKRCKYTEDQIGAAKWFLNRGLPITRTAELLNMALTIVTDIRKGSVFPRVPVKFPSLLMDKDDIEGVEEEIKKIRKRRRRKET